MFWILIIVVVIIVFVSLNNKKSGGANQKNQWKGAPGASQNNVARFSLEVNSPQDYSSILNSLQRIVEDVAMRTYCEIGVVVQVIKLDDTYCKVFCQMLADSSFRNSNILFGEGFSFNGDDLVRFDTQLATGFTNPDDVKREILLQFNWSDVSVSNAGIEVFPGSNGPGVSYQFTVRG